MVIAMQDAHIDTFVNKLERLFEDNANPEISSKQSAYLKNNFQFYGIQKPQRKILQKSLFKDLSIKSESELVKVLDKLWKRKKRELHYAAIDLAQKYLSLATDQIILTLEKMIRTNSWWDTVDIISSSLVGPTLLRFPKLKLVVDVWIQDSDMWIRRSALIFQLRYKHETDEELLFNYCCCVMSEKEFFIKKAIGWALREYSKTSPKSVSNFIYMYRSKLSPLSIREGLEIISKCP